VRKARPLRSTILLVVAALVVAGAGGLGHRTYVTSASSAADDARARSEAVPPVADPNTNGDQGHLLPPRTGERRGDRPGAVLGRAGGAVPDGVTVFDDTFPAVARLDPALLGAVRRAATDAEDLGITFSVNSGWRSRAYQDQLLREAIVEHGSEEEAVRWVATADTSPHVSGDAIDLGPSDATAWLSQHGARYGLCQIYRNEPWHYELRPDAVARGCPAMYADPAHDPRMQ
jgi:hypothetical protein